MYRTSSSSTAGSSTVRAGKASIACSRQEGFNVSVVQNPTLSLAGRRDGDPTSARPAGRPHDPGRALLRRSGDQRGRHATRTSPASSTSPRSRPTQGESVNTLIAGFPQDGPQPPILPPQDGFLFLDREKFADFLRRGRRAARRPRSWPTRRFHGASTRSEAPSPTRLAQQAELVPRRDRRPHDPAAGAAGDGGAHGRDDVRGAGQPRDLRLAARRGRRRDLAGRPKRAGGCDGRLGVVPEQVRQ